MSPVPPRRDVDVFERRAPAYDQGRLGRLHHDIGDRAAALAVSLHPDGRRVLDVGCGTGYLLRSLALRYPRARVLAGVDPARSMVETASRSSDDERLTFSVGTAESLPFPDASADLVVSTTSFDHWADQLGGLRECGRVLEARGRLLLVDQFSLWLTPTLLGERRAKARTRRRATALLEEAGFTHIAWHPVYAVIINGVSATWPALDDRPKGTRHLSGG